MEDHFVALIHEGARRGTAEPIGGTGDVRQRLCRSRLSWPATASSDSPRMTRPAPMVGLVDCAAGELR